MAEKKSLGPPNIQDRYITVGSTFERLLNEYNKHGSLYIGYDFDGTVHDFHKVGDTYPRVIKLLQNLKSIGCKVMCWTAYEDLDYVKKYLEENNIPCDGINCDAIPLKWKTRKPFYSALLDDRAGLRQVVLDLELLVTNVQLNLNKENGKV